MPRYSTHGGITDASDKPTGEAVLAATHGSVNLVEAIKAAWRLRYYGYHDWALAGGVDECRHGIAAGIHCARCDELLLNEAYKQVSSPNFVIVTNNGVATNRWQEAR